MNYFKDKAILYTTFVPILKIVGERAKDTVEYELKKHAMVTVDERPDDDLFRLIVKFVVPEKTVILSLI